MSDLPEVPEVPERDAARITPYQLIFGAPVFDETQFEAVREQVDRHGAASPGELLLLPAAGELLRMLAPGEGGQEMVAQVGALLFSAFRFWLHGRNVYRVPESVLRTLLSGPAPTTRAVPALPAGYVQLPRNVMWARVAEDAAPEPVDGFFWSAPESGGRLDLLFALGVRPGRPGISLFDVSLETVQQLDAWKGVSVRPEGEDFANVLPGGELQDYRAITTGAEALKLAALCVACIADPDVQWTATREGSQNVHGIDDG